MDPDFFLRLRTLFEEIVDLPADEQKSFLDEHCEGNLALRQAVEALLEADEEAGSFLRGPRIDASGSTPPQLQGSGSTPAPSGSPEATPHQDIQGLAHGDPAKVGPYRLLRRLGQGGMGVVYLAVRDDDSFQRRVVVKLVRQDVENEALLLRLRNERRILASLDHPNIARLFDGGSMEDNRPYFVMEFIEGIPIDLHCNLQQMSIHERLVLFRKVCAAVHYAHQNLVVHRDLKPSNILIGVDGEPKLLDFGIAKLLNPELANHEQHLTASWHRYMTPQFASPEQASGNPITTATDIYSLGILLFRLLTDSYPFNFSGLRPQQIETVLLTQEPPKPSAAILSPLEDPKVPAQRSANEIARDRQLTAPNLSKALMGDLDSIVLKALRSAPQRRYESANHFAADIERFQQGLPVEAHVGSFSYRAAKYFKRHRVALAVVGMMTALLLAFTGTVAWQSRQVAEERDASQLEKRRKEEVLSLLLDVLRVADPHVNAGRKLTVQEALMNSRSRLQHRLRDEPLLRAETLHTTGRIYFNLGLWEQAKTDLEEAVLLRQGLSGEHPEVAESLGALALVESELGELDRAQSLSTDALAMARRAETAPRILLATLVNRVTVLCFDHQFAAADPLAMEAVALGRKNPEQYPDLLASALSNLGNIRLHQDKYLEAADLLQQSVKVFESLGGVNNPILMKPLNNLGSALRRADDLEGAEEAFQRTLELQKLILGDDHPALVSTLNNLGGLLGRRGKPAEAEVIYQRALKLFLPEVGENHPRVFFLRLKVASSRLQQGKASEADSSLATLLSRWRPLLPPQHRFVAMGLTLRGEALLALERYEQAEALLLESQSMVTDQGDHEQAQDIAAILRQLYKAWDQPGTPQKTEIPQGG